MVECGVTAQLDNLNQEAGQPQTETGKFMKHHGQERADKGSDNEN